MLDVARIRGFYRKAPKDPAASSPMPMSMIVASLKCND